MGFWLFNDEFFSSFIVDKLRVLQDPSVSRYSRQLAFLLQFAITLCQEPETSENLKILLTDYQVHSIKTFISSLSHEDLLVNEESFLISYESGPFEGDEEEDDVSETEDDLPSVNPLGLKAAEQDTLFSSQLESPLLLDLHRCLLSLFTHGNYDILGSFHFLPSYVIFRSLDQDGKFKAARKQTPLNAILKYIGKAVFLQTLFVRAREEGRDVPFHG